MQNELEFFKLASQIIPVLFLAITLQSVTASKVMKYEKGEESLRTFRFTIFYLTAGFAILGEAFALANIYLGTVLQESFAVVVMAMVVSVAYIIAEQHSIIAGKAQKAPLYILLALNALLLLYAGYQIAAL